MTAEAIDRLVKALSYPYAGSHVEIGNSNFKVFNSKIIKNKELNIIPEKYLKLKKSLTVKCYIDAIEIFNERLSTYCKKEVFVLRNYLNKSLKLNINIYCFLRI